MALNIEYIVGNPNYDIQSNAKRKASTRYFSGIRKTVSGIFNRGYEAISSYMTKRTEEATVREDAEDAAYLGTTNISELVNQIMVRCEERSKPDLRSRKKEVHAYRTANVSDIDQVLIHNYAFDNRIRQKVIKGLVNNNFDVHDSKETHYCKRTLAIIAENERRQRVYSWRGNPKMDLSLKYA
jgi:hypothetical protein